MGHWSVRWLGRPCVLGEMDCAILVEQVEAEVFGRHLALPSERRPGPFWLSAQIASHRHLAQRVDQPREGDGVLLRANGRLQHIGVYVVIAGVAHVLHAAQSAGAVVRHRIDRLDAAGYAVEGYYRWR